MKLGLIGIGKVGSQILTDIQYQNLFSEIVVIDTNEKLARGEVLDHQHAQGFDDSNHVKISAGDYHDLSDAAVIIVTASTPMNAMMPDRVLLAEENGKLMADLMQRIARVTQEAVIIFISNPVDAMTYIASTTVNYPKHQIMGTGTLLESARFKTLIANHYGIDPKSVHAFVIGEHGKNAVPVWSKVTIFGMPIKEFESLMKCEPIDQASITAQIDKVAFDVLQQKDWTNTAISKAAVALTRHIVLDERTILPVTALLDGDYGTDACAMSLPALVTREGIEYRFPIELSETEQSAVNEAISYIQQAIKTGQLK